MRKTVRRVLVTFAGTVLLLSGCAERTDDVSAEGSGLVDSTSADHASPTASASASSAPDDYKARLIGLCKEANAMLLQQQQGDASYTAQLANRQFDNRRRLLTRIAQVAGPEETVRDVEDNLVSPSLSVIAEAQPAVLDRV